MISLIVYIAIVRGVDDTRQLSSTSFEFGRWRWVVKRIFRMWCGDSGGIGSWWGYPTLPINANPSK